MPVLDSPMIRIVFHLLLGVAVLLQAGTASAMHHGAAINEDAADSAAASNGAEMPPCHATAVEPDQSAPTDDCCDASPLGKLCQWACAQAMSLASPALVFPVLAQPLERARAIAPTEASWTPSTPLRPPIAPPIS